MAQLAYTGSGRNQLVDRGSEHKVNLNQYLADAHETIGVQLRECEPRSASENNQSGIPLLVGPISRARVGILSSASAARTRLIPRKRNKVDASEGITFSWASAHQASAHCRRGGGPRPKDTKGHARGCHPFRRRSVSPRAACSILFFAHLPNLSAQLFFFPIPPLVLFSCFVSVL